MPFNFLYYVLKTMVFLLMEQYIKNTEMHIPLCKPKHQENTEYAKNTCS